MTICGQYYKTFLGVIYATSGMFPYDFDWGYADSNVITDTKSFITLATGWSKSCTMVGAKLGDNYWDVHFW
jgi:hypothetical protein